MRMRSGTITHLPWWHIPSVSRLQTRRGMAGGSTVLSTHFRASFLLSFEGRGIDTAWNYNQQVVVGWAINNASQQVRDELFITTKIPCVASAAAALQYIEQDLQQLNVTSVDLVSPCCVRRVPGPPARMFLKYAYRAHRKIRMFVHSTRTASTDAMVFVQDMSAVSTDANVLKVCVLVPIARVLVQHASIGTCSCTARAPCPLLTTLDELSVHSTHVPCQEGRQCIVPLSKAQSQWQRLCNKH